MNTGRWADALADCLGRPVVIDVTQPIVYIGTLCAADEDFFTLEQVDVHELAGGNVTKEVYVMEVARNGIQPTREKVRLKQAEVISLSALDEIIIY